MITIKESKFYSLSCILLILGLENIVIFFKHYFFDSAFPWDFNLTYYAVPYYWITSLQHGYFPGWIAQQAMGYPIFMNLQSGFFYPLLWLFVLLQKTYTLHSAVVLQCLHVFMASVGMYYFCRVQKIARSYSLLAAVGYQLFGGFCLNAEDVDMIRGFAITPWFLAGLVMDVNRCLPFRTLVLVPLTLFLFATGAYPGQLIAALFIGVFLSIMQAFLCLEEGWGSRLKLSISRIGLFLLGIGLGSLAILPAWLLRDTLVRNAVSDSIFKSFFIYKNIFTAFLPCKHLALPQDLSMQSVFITLPLFGMLFYLGGKRLKNNLHYLLVMLLVILMTTNSFFYQAITKYIHALGLSRFPDADYKAYLAIFAIYLAVLALKDLIDNKTVRFVMVRSILFVIVTLGGYFIARAGHQRVLTESFLLLLISSVIFLIYIFIIMKRKFHSVHIVAAFIVFSALYGTLAWHIDKRAWNFPYSTANFEANFKGIDLVGLRPKQLVSQLAELPRRPNRLDEKLHPPAWRGYLTGDFMLTDYVAGMQLSAQNQIIADPVLVSFMQQPSSYLLLEKESANNINVIKNAVHHLLTSAKESSIDLLSFSSDKIVYNVVLRESKILIENEMYFAGWKADLVLADKKVITLSALKVAGGLRAWQLPKGKYKFVEYFEMPYLYFASILSFTAFLAWLLMLILYAYKSKKNNT